MEVVHTSIRKTSDHSYDELIFRPSYADYLSSNRPTTLPLLIEADYITQEFERFASSVFEKHGYDSAQVDLQYCILDVIIEPKIQGEEKVHLPFMLFSRFRYKTLTINGPFIAGHQAGLSMIQSGIEPRYARFSLSSAIAKSFTPSVQTNLIAKSVAGIVSDSEADAVFAALPDRGRDPSEYRNSNIMRVLTGGHILDVIHNIPVFSIFPSNPLKGIPFKIIPVQEDDAYVRHYSIDFTYYSFNDSDIHETLLTDGMFVRLLNIVRFIGPKFKSECSEHSNGLLFNPEDNLEFAKEFIKRCS